MERENMSEREYYQITAGDQRDYRVQGVVQTGHPPLAPHGPAQPSFLHPLVQHVVTKALLQLVGLEAPHGS